MDNIMKVVKSHEESDLLKKDVRETNKNEAKETSGTKKWIFQHVIRYIRCQFLMKLLTGKEVKDKIPGRGVIRLDEITIKVGQAF